MDVAADGTVFIADRGNHRVRRVSPDGTITTVAGNGTAGYSGDAVLGSLASLSHPTDIAVGPDGSLFIADQSNHRVRRLDPLGRIWTYAGTGEGTNFLTASGSPPGTDENIGNGVLATQAKLFDPTGVAVGSDGSLYIAAKWNFRIRKVTPDGVIRTIAGVDPDVNPGAVRCEGCPGTESLVMTPDRVSVASDGSVFFTEIRNNGFDPQPSHRVRQILPDGRVVTLNETGGACFSGPLDGPVARACMTGPLGTAVGPDGALYVAQSSGGTDLIRKISPVFGGFSPTSEVVVASQGGTEAFVFSKGGRHLRTMDTLTGTARRSFGYDADGRLTSAADPHGNVTRFEHRPGGVSVIAPGGQRTELDFGPDGFLAALDNPAGERWGIDTRADGLVTAIRNPRGVGGQYFYDADGRAIEVVDAAGARTALTLLESTPLGGSAGALSQQGGYSLETLLRSPEARETRYRVLDQDGRQTRRNTFPDGTEAVEVRHPDGSREVTRADGMSYQTALAPDPRFGMLAPFARETRTRTPSGASLVTTRTRSTSLSAPGNPFSLTGQTDTVTVNGKTWQSTYSAGPPRRTTSRSPEGRIATSDLDEFGRVVRAQTADLAPVNLVYRADGLLESTVQGEFPDARAVSMTYNARRELASVTDPLGRTTSFQRDLAGRVTRQVLPDGREVLTSYDANGNVTSVTPPSRPEHRFTYTPIDLEETYDPPNVPGATPGVTSYEYDLDRRLLRAVRPDGATVNLSYHAPGGKLSQIAHAAGTVAYTYDPVTGRLAAMSESGGSSLTYEYDGSLALSETMLGPVSGQVSRAYDSDFRVREERVNGLDAVAVVYDDDSLPTQVGDLLLSRNPVTGLLDGTMLGSVATARSTNAFAEPIAESAHVGATEALAFAYTRDSLGRITELRETIGGITTTRVFTYDPTGRLTDVHVDGFHAAHWAYDGNSNRVSATTALGTVTADYDDQDRLLRYGDATFAYTANGELTTRTDLAGTTSYFYDALGNLRHVELADGRVVEYLIDARNRRVGKKVDGVLVQGWLYRDQLEPVAELDGAGNVVSRFVYATKSHSPDYVIKDGVTYRILTDHLGSPRLVIDVDTGAIVQRMDFDEWGVVTLDTNPGFQPFGFAGGLLDADTGLTRFGARDYAAAEGRWTAKDPIGFVDLGLFNYCFNDPVNLADRSGKAPGYIDVNITVGPMGGGPVATGGVLVGDDGVNFYLGGGVATSSGVSFSASPNAIAPGGTFGCGLFGPSGVGGQLGSDFPGLFSSPFGEFGIGTPGVFATAFHVFNPSMSFEGEYLPPEWLEDEAGDQTGSPPPGDPLDGLGPDPFPSEPSACPVCPDQ